jgi:hypothetical protein
MPPIFYPPGPSQGPGFPTQPIVLPPTAAMPPIYYPPTAPGHPAHPIPPGVWPMPPNPPEASQGPGFPTQPIYPWWPGLPSQGPGFPTNPIAPGGPPPQVTHPIPPIVWPTPPGTEPTPLPPGVVTPPMTLTAGQSQPPLNVPGVGTVSVLAYVPGADWVWIGVNASGPQPKR